MLVIGSFIFYSGSLALIVACYHFYAQLATCGLNIFFITFTLVLTIVYTLVSAQAGSWTFLQAGCSQWVHASPHNNAHTDERMYVVMLTAACMASVYMPVADRSLFPC